MTVTFIIAFVIWIIVVVVLLGTWISPRKSSIAGKPILRQGARISMVPQFFVMGVLVVIFTLFVEPFWLALCLGVMAYLLISFILERCIPNNHRKGILLSKQGNYMQAIEEYKKSYNFFCKHSWIDKYRYLALLSSSRVSYTEMALLNIAFCYAQLNDVKLTKEYYQKTLEFFPDSEIAKSALKKIGEVS